MVLSGKVRGRVEAFRAGCRCDSPLRSSHCAECHAIRLRGSFIAALISHRKHVIGTRLPQRSLLSRCREPIDSCRVDVKGIGDLFDGLPLVYEPVYQLYLFGV